MTKLVFPIHICKLVISFTLALKEYARTQTVLFKSEQHEMWVESEAIRRACAYVHTLHTYHLGATVEQMVRSKRVFIGQGGKGKSKRVKEYVCIYSIQCSSLDRRL